MLCPLCDSLVRDDEESVDSSTELIEDLAEGVQSGEYQGYIFCAILDDGSYHVGVSGDMSFVEELGLLEAAKNDIVAIDRYLEDGWSDDDGIQPD